MRVREQVYAVAIGVACLVALATPFWWSAVATFALAEATVALLERRERVGVAEVVPLPRREAPAAGRREAA